MQFYNPQKHFSLPNHTCRRVRTTDILHGTGEENIFRLGCFIICIFNLKHYLGGQQRNRKVPDFGTSFNLNHFLEIPNSWDQFDHKHKGF